jgi:small subunit ribosomal protein S11
MLVTVSASARFKKYANRNKFVFSKKPQPKKAGFFNELEYPRIYIRNNSKTLFFTLTDKSGRVLCAFSSGMVGFKGSKRLGTPAVDSLSRKVALFAKQLNMKVISVVLKVTNNLFNITAMKIFFDHGLKVLKITERVPLSHNGRRFKKSRRI